MPNCASMFVTTTATAPRACGGVVALIEVAFANVTLVAEIPPMVTVAPAANPVPVIVTGVPPAVGPVAGEIPVTVGAALVAAVTVIEVLVAGLGFEVLRK